MFVPKGAPPIQDIDHLTEDDLYVGVPQVSMQSTSIINFRDLRGRTPLHIAVALGNRPACESLLFLGANPLLEDIFG